jgi:CrcB protein
MLKNLFIIGAGGAIGSMLRYLTGYIIGSRSFPLPTLLVNAIGSFIIGIVIAFSLKNESFANNWKLFLATGICGGFTTFSAFSLENLQLLQNGKFFLCAFYITASVLLGIVTAWLGFKLIN